MVHPFRSLGPAFPGICLISEKRKLKGQLSGLGLHPAPLGSGMTHMICMEYLPCADSVLNISNGLTCSSLLIVMGSKIKS